MRMSIHGVKKTKISKWKINKTDGGIVFWTKDIEVYTDESKCAEQITLHTHDAELVKRENGDME